MADINFASVAAKPNRIYIVGKVFEWIIRNGGVEGIGERSKLKSETIYSVINESNGFHTCPVKSDCRSRMNIPFRIKEADENLEKEFLSGAQELGMIQLKGHRVHKGISLSLMPSPLKKLKQTEALANYMKDFCEKHRN